MISSSDRVQVAYPLLASAGQVWDAISDAGKFGIWFGAELHGQFAANANLAGKLVPTNSHPGLGRAQQRYLGSTFTISIDRVDPAAHPVVSLATGGYCFGGELPGRARDARLIRTGRDRRPAVDRPGRVTLPVAPARAGDARGEIPQQHEGPPPYSPPVVRNTPMPRSGNPATHASLIAISRSALCADPAALSATGGHADQPALRDR